MMTHVILEREFVKRIKPEIKEVAPFLSKDTFPELLRRHSGKITLFDFLNMSIDNAHDMAEDLTMALTPLVDFFCDDKLSRAYERLLNLSDLLLEGGVDV